MKAKLNKILDTPENEELTNEQIQRLIELAKEAGVEISAEDIENYIDAQENNSENLTEEELDMVAAGTRILSNDINNADGVFTVIDNIDFPTSYGYRACFMGDSKISTPAGAKVIRNIKVGDEVYSLDAQNNKIVAKVIEVRPVFDEEIVKIEFSNGAIWYTTATQWFYCGRFYGNDDDYACAIDSKGKAALTENGEKVTVVKAEKTGEIKKVYDFITDGLNLFFVEGIAAEGYSID